MSGERWTVGRWKCGGRPLGVLFSFGFYPLLDMQCSRAEGSRGRAIAFATCCIALLCLHTQHQAQPRERTELLAAAASSPDTRELALIHGDARLLLAHTIVAQGARRDLRASLTGSKHSSLSTVLDAGEFRVLSTEGV